MPSNGPRLSAKQVQLERDVAGLLYSAGGALSKERRGTLPNHTCVKNSDDQPLKNPH